MEVWGYELIWTETTSNADKCEGIVDPNLGKVDLKVGKLENFRKCRALCPGPHPLPDPARTPAQERYWIGPGI